MSSNPITEQSSYYDNLENMSVSELLININNEDKKVPLAVEKSIPQIEGLVENLIDRFEKGGDIMKIYSKVGPILFLDQLFPALPSKICYGDGEC